MIEPPIAAQTAPAPATGTTPKAPIDPVAAPLPNTNAMPMRIATRMENPDIVIDGHVDEAAWQAVDAYDNMRVMEPETLAEPTYATASRFIYTDEGLYVSAVMEQTAGNVSGAALLARSVHQPRWLRHHFGHIWQRAVRLLVFGESRRFGGGRQRWRLNATSRTNGMALARCLGNLRERLER